MHRYIITFRYHNRFALGGKWRDSIEKMSVDADDELDAVKSFKEIVHSYRQNVAFISVTKGIQEDCPFED